MVPKEVIIELTNRCNLKCDFCYNHGGNEELPKEEVFGLLDQIKQSGIKAVRFTGGEPFLRQDLIEILRYAKNLGLYVILNTNATLINEQNASCFDYVDLVLFSFHDIEKKEIILEKMRFIKGPKIMLATIIVPKNIEKIEEFYEFISEIKQHNIVEWFLLRPVNTKALDKDNIKKIFDKIIQNNKKYGMDVKIANSIPFCAIKDVLHKVCKGGKFDSGHTRIMVDVKGNIRADYFSGEIGDISQHKVIDIWNKLEKRRKYHDVKEECKECYHLEKCKGALGKEDPLINYDNVNPLVSVIIPTYSHKEMLMLVIRSLLLQRCRNSIFEIIIADDGSSDGTKEMVEELQNRHNKIKYIFQEDKGFRAGQARNLGASIAEGKILIFLDDDSVIHPDLIVNHLKAQKKADIVLGYSASYGSDGSYDVNEVKKLLEKKNELDKLRIIKEFRENIFSQDIKDKWRFFVASNFSIKKKVFDEFKFDEDFVGWAEEDVELGYSLWKAGKRIVFDKSCMAFDVRAKNDAEYSMMTKERFLSTTKNQLLLYKKHPSPEVKSYILDRYNNVPENYSDGTYLDLEKGIFDVK